MAKGQGPSGQCIGHERKHALVFPCSGGQALWVIVLDEIG